MFNLDYQSVRDVRENEIKGNVYVSVVINGPADDLAPLGARASAVTVMTRVGPVYIYICVCVCLCVCVCVCVCVGACMYTGAAFKVKTEDNFTTIGGHR